MMPDMHADSRPDLRRLDRRRRATLRCRRGRWRAGRRHRAWDLAREGRDVLLLDKAGRIKPCGGAIPPRLMQDFDIPEELLCARISSARMVSPKEREVDMPIGGRLRRHGRP